jgi:plastocyanin
MQGVLRLGVVLGVVIGGMAAASCGGDGSGMTGPGADDAAVQVTVTRDGSPAQGVTVRLYAVGGSSPQATRTTAANGVATFASLAAGSYEVEIEVPAGTELGSGAPRRPVTAQAGATATVAFALVSAGGGTVVEVLAGGNLQFAPADVTIDVATTVRWVNEAGLMHTITPDGHSEWAEGTVSAAGDSFSHTFETAGTYPYECVLHVGMTGVVRVQ